jgi:uncharacterized membrane protein
MIPILRLVHIISGVFWVGSILFVTVLLMPSIRAAGPSGMAIMKELGRRRMPLIMMVSGILTVGAGIWLMLVLSGGAVGVWMRSSTGRAFGTGGGLAILALVLGMSINVPTTQRMSAIGAAVAKRGGPPTADEASELQRLQSRLGIASVVVAVLLLLATAAMAVARYLR